MTKMDTSRPCEECGLPIIECNALMFARTEAVTYLRERGVPGPDALARVNELIPPVRKAVEYDHDDPRWRAIARIDDKFGIGLDAARHVLRTNSEAKRIYDCALEAMTDAEKDIDRRRRENK